MIRICYEDFTAGTHDVTALHGRVERGARGVTLSLLPGLTAGQRRAVIRRLRQEASRGFGPPLPQPQLAVALGLDRVRTAARIVGAIVRLHPAVTLVPSVFVVVVMALFVIASSKGPGSAPKAAVALAENARAGGGSPQAESVRPNPAEMARATVAVGTGIRASGPGRRDQAKPVHGKGRHGKVPARATARSGAWYVSPPVATGPVPCPAAVSLLGGAHS